MTYRLHPYLVNGRFGDPVVYVDLRYERRGILFDIGDISSLPRAKIVQVSDLCISHAHMDHLAGFDGFLRRLLRQDLAVRIYGPEGIIEHVGHHLAGFSWNLVDQESPDLRFDVTEIVSETELRSAVFSERDGFKTPTRKSHKISGGVLHQDRDIKLCGILLDHKIASVAYSVEESQSINILKSGLTEMGLSAGSWLDEFKHAVAEKAPGDKPLAAVRADGCAAEFSLSELKKRLITVTLGHKVAFVVDAGRTTLNEEKIIALARGADILFIEAAFARSDEALADARYHLTTTDAGRIAAKAGVGRVEPLHLSLRYQGEEERVLQEVQDAFEQYA